MSNVDIDAKIPNNVGLADDRRLQRALESSPAGPGEIVEGLADGVELPLHLVDLAGVLLPLLAEGAEQLHDLVARLLDGEVVECLADHPEEGEERERAAQDDLLLHRVVEQLGVVLVDELMNAVQGKITNVSSRERTRRKKSARRVCALPSRARRGDASRLSTYLPV